MVTRLLLLQVGLLNGKTLNKMQNKPLPTIEQVAEKMATWSQERYHQERTYLQMCDLAEPQKRQLLQLMENAWALAGTRVALQAPAYHTHQGAPGWSVPPPREVNSILVPVAKIAGAGGAIYLGGSALVAAAPVVQAALSGFFAAVMAPLVAVLFVGFLAAMAWHLAHAGHGTWQSTDGPTPGGGGGGKKRRVVMEQTQRTYLEED